MFYSTQSIQDVIWFSLVLLLMWQISVVHIWKYISVVHIWKFGTFILLKLMFSYHDAIFYFKL